MRASGLGMGRWVDESVFHSGEEPETEVLRFHNVERQVLSSSNSILFGGCFHPI